MDPLATLGRTFGEVRVQRPSRNHLEAGFEFLSTFLPSSFSDSTQHPQSVVGKSIATMLIPKADRKAIHEVWKCPQSQRKPALSKTRDTIKKSTSKSPQLCGVTVQLQRDHLDGLMRGAMLQISGESFD